MPKRSLEKLEKQYKLVKIFFATVGITATGLVIKKLMSKNGEAIRAINILEMNRAHLEKQYLGCGRIINRKEIMSITRKMTRLAGKLR